MENENIKPELPLQAFNLLTGIKFCIIFHIQVSQGNKFWVWQIFAEALDKFSELFLPKKKKKKKKKTCVSAHEYFKSKCSHEQIQRVA